MQPQAVTGLVVSHLGKGLAVEDEHGIIRLCHTRRRLGDVAVGDRVQWELCEDDQGRVLAVEPRHSQLIRPGYAGRIRIVAANIDLVCIVLAPEPEPDWLLVDQILSVCQRQGIAVALLMNKIEKMADYPSQYAVFAEYRDAGYHCFELSAKLGTGIAVLLHHLQGRNSLFSGQSGVGKSSLTNALLPDKALRVGALSEKSGLGKHTTTAATLFHLPGGGQLIDSPGVAIFGLAEMKATDLAEGYREFLPYLGHCQFNDCRHVQDKGCAIVAAVHAGAISSGRYQRFLRLLGRLQVPQR